VSYLVVTEKASDTLLAPIAVLRAAAGLAADDASRDTELTALGQRISAEIVEACRIAVGEGAEPTLRKETLTETFSGCCDDVLILSRRHNVKITSVTEDGNAVTIDARGLKSEAGLLERWVDGCRSRWWAKEIVVVYDAGFDTSPPSLVGVVTDLARMRLSQASVDPLVKSVRVEVTDIDTVQTDRWVGATPGSEPNGALPAEIIARLSRFMNPVV
jgi:hypothetical protein